MASRPAALPDEGLLGVKKQRKSPGRPEIHLQQMADQIRIPITVCHYPPGTSKWNKIERRLFSFYQFEPERAAVDQL